MRFQSESPKAVSREATGWEVRLRPRAQGCQAVPVGSQFKSVLIWSPQGQLGQQISKPERLQSSTQKVSD